MVVDVEKDPEARTMTITADLDGSVERVWRLWADPRQLERWWGPPASPATVVEHDLRPGGTVSYYVITPDGDRISGWWHVLAVEPPHRLDLELGGPDIPAMATRVGIDARPEGGTRMTIRTTFPSIEAMDQLLAIGFDQGMATAVGQIDAVLRAPRSPGGGGGAGRCR